MRTMMLSLLVALLAATAIVCPAPCWGQSIQDGSEAIVDKGITYEIPKAYELMHIAIALTDTSIVSNGYNLYHEVTDTSTQYYKAVMRYFGPYRNHPLIEALNASLKKSASNYLYNLQMAYNSALVNGQVVEQDRLSPALRIVYSLNSVPRKQLDSFSRATQFDVFYQQQRAYYAQGLAKAKEKADVDNQQRWLERYFSARYAQYNIVLSPLMYGTHFTQRFVQHEKPTCVMWVSLPSHDTGSGTRLHTARYIGTVMTEIDHNYINPASDRYTKLINRVMGDSNRKNWVTATYSSNSYQTGYKVFNEYMTHAAYLLYTAERLGAADQAVLESGKIQSMERRRGFHRFGAFYRALRQLFAPVQATQTIESLYPAILDWCQKQNEE